jgi:hypothetical protein
VTNVGDGDSERQIPAGTPTIDESDDLVLALADAEREMFDIIASPRTAEMLAAVSMIRTEVAATERSAGEMIRTLDAWRVSDPDTFAADPMRAAELCERFEIVRRTGGRMLQRIDAYLGGA